MEVKKGKMAEKVPKGDEGEKDGKMKEETTRRGRGRPRKEDKERDEAKQMKDYLNKGSCGFTINFGRKSEVARSPVRNEQSKVENGKKEGENAREEEKDNGKEWQEVEATESETEATAENTNARAQVSENTTEEEKEPEKEEEAAGRISTVPTGENGKDGKTDAVEENTEGGSGVRAGLIEYEDEIRLREKEMQKNIFEGIKIDLERWRNEIESGIRAEFKMEVDDLKEKVRLGEEIQETQQRELERMERRVEDLQNLWVEERNRRVEDKRLMWTAIETKRWVEINTGNKEEDEQGNGPRGLQQTGSSGEDQDAEHDDNHQRGAETEEEDEEECMSKIPERLGKGELDFEMIERLERKNNIFIRGVKTVGKGIKGEIRNLLEERLDIPVKIAECRAIGGGLVLTINTFKNKVGIMKQKAKLRGTNIWIEDDLTEREKEVNEWLRKLAKAEERKGNDVRTGYLKIRINDEWKFWNEKLGELETKCFRG